METDITLRPLFSYLEDAERRGIFVRCPLVRGPRDVSDCMTCAHYRGIVSSDEQLFRVRCTEPDPASRAAEPGRPNRSLRFVPQPG